MRRANLLRWLGCSAMVLALGGVAPAAETLDLKFGESRQFPSVWTQHRQRDGFIRLPFGATGKFLVMKVVGDHVRVDTNGDGRLDDDDAPAFRPEEQRTTRIYVPFEIAGKPLKYPLHVRWAGNAPMVSSAAVLTGQFAGHTISIYDSNLDGRFGGSRDEIQLQKRRQEADPLPWSDALAIDGRIYRLKVLDDGARLKLEPYAGPVAEVEIEAAAGIKMVHVTLREADGAQVARIPRAETGLLIPGKYRIDWAYGYVGAGDDAPILSGRHKEKTAPLELKPGRNIINVGPPMKISFSATRSGLTLELADVEIAGMSGELYRPGVNAAEGDTFAVFIKSNGKERALGKLKFAWDGTCGSSVLVPDELANADDAEVIVRIQTTATGNVETSIKLSAVPKRGMGKTLRSLLGI